MMEPITWRLPATPPESWWWTANPEVGGVGVSLRVAASDQNQSGPMQAQSHTIATSTCVPK